MVKGGEGLLGARAPARSYKVVVAGVAVALAMIAMVALAMPGRAVELEQSDSQKALSLEMAKKNYDTAKDRVSALHREFNKLKQQLQSQVSNLQEARGDLVSQIGDSSAPFTMKTDSPATEDTSFVTHPAVKSLRSAAATLAAAGTSKDAADAATHALSYTQQVASRVGDLADQSEEQAKRIVDAARLAQEAKEAMRAALEQSSKIVDYNTHAAQAVAQDSGFVTTAAQTISGYLHNIFHDSRAVHAAAVQAVKHMNADVGAADKAVNEIESDANEAYDVLQHISKADAAAHDYAHHARAAAVTAATAANGALKGERAAMIGGLKAIASAHSAQAAAKASMEYANAAQSATHPYVYGGATAQPAVMGYVPAPDQGVPQGAVVPEVVHSGGKSDVAGAKRLVDGVVVLMQQLTNALQSADDCNKVHEVLTYYQAMMAKFHAEGQELAGALSPDDMDLVEQYAQTQVAAFATDLEAVVRKTADKCKLPVESFIPDSALAQEAPPAAKGGDAKLSAPDAGGAPEAKAAGGSGGAAKIAKLKSELAWVRRERLLKKESKAAGPARGGKGAIRKAVEKEARHVSSLRAEIAALQQEKARLTGTL